MSKFYLDEKTPLLKHCSSYFNCRLLNNNGLMPKIISVVLARPPPGGPRKIFRSKRGPQPEKRGNRWPSACTKPYTTCTCSFKQAYKSGVHISLVADF